MYANHMLVYIMLVSLCSVYFCLHLFTNYYFTIQVLSQQPLEAVLEWCHISLPSLFQVTSFGSTGMVIIHAMHKLGLKVSTRVRCVSACGCECGCMRAHA